MPLAAFFGLVLLVAYVLFLTAVLRGIGRIGEHGELQYIAAATTLALRSGETVVVGETSRDLESSTRDLHGVSRENRQEQQLLLISVEIQQ